MKNTPLAAVALVLALSLSLGSSSLPFGPQAADAGPVAGSTRGRVVIINRRPYLLTLNLRVIIPGAPIDPMPPFYQTMQCAATLTALDGRPVGRLPDRLTLSLSSRGERRTAVMNLFPSDVLQPINTAAYFVSVGPFGQNDSSVNAVIGSNDRIGFRAVAINNLAVQVLLLPGPLFLPD